MFKIGSLIRPMVPRIQVPTAALNMTPRIAPAITQINPIRTFKVRTSVKKFCKDCYMVRRKGRVYVYCKSNGKHKQRQG